MANGSSFSVSNPERAPYKAEAIKDFFEKFCGKNSFRTPIISNPDSCEVNYPNEGLFTNVPGTDLGYFTKNIKVSFQKFESNKLFLKYRTTYDWRNQKDKLPLEIGGIEIDLSNLTKKDDEVIYQLNPYIGISEIPIDKIENQPKPFDEKTKKWSIYFPSVLSFFTFDIFNIESFGSMTNGNKFPYFPIKDKSDSFYELKNYFNNGTLKRLSFGRALAYSFSTFMSFGVADIYPRTSWLKVLCSLQTLLGIIIFGLFTTSLYDKIRQLPHG